MSLPFPLPPLVAGGITPEWSGDGFRIGTEFVPILSYSLNNQGWNDSLTLFHEESATDKHFIAQASRKHTLEQLTKHIKDIEHPTILEVGCSSGCMLHTLVKNFPTANILGADVVKEALEKVAATLPNVPLFQFDLVHCPLPDNSMDAIVLLNVLEHIENDSAAIDQVYRILKPNGIAIIEVPSGPHLYDFYDKILLHYRRYTLSGLNTLLKNQGFSVVKKSHLGFFLYPGFWYVKHRNQKLLIESDTILRQKIEKAIHHTRENKFMNFFMQCEHLIGKFFDFPVGIRCLISCKKPSINT